MNRSHVGVLIRMVKWPKKVVCGAFLVSMLTAVLGILVPWVTKNTIDSFTSHIDATKVFLLVGLFLINVILSGIAHYMISYLGEYTIYRLREKMWAHILRLPIDYFDNNGTGQTVSRLTDDVSTLNNFVSKKVPEFISQALLVVGSIVFLFVLDWRLTLALLVMVPILAVIIVPIGKKLYIVAGKTQNEMATFVGKLSSVLGEMRLVKSYSGEKKEYERVMESGETLFRLNLTVAKLQSIFSPLISGTIMLMVLVLLGYGGLRMADGTITPGAFVAIIFYIIQAITPISSVASFFTEYKATSGATKRLYEIYSLSEENVDELDECTKIMDGQICFHNVSFSYYKNSDVLQDVSFTAQSNRITAIVGPSGAGKTTLFHLIERMYKFNNGMISCDQLRIDEIPLSNWRKMIGYVMQDSAIMNGTIRENILYGMDDADEERLVHYAKLANAHDFISSLPEGYDTVVGERGIKLSGGQKQRIAIARAFIMNPKILLLDEATANLDSESERLVQDAMVNLMRNRTTLVIAHRLSTIRNADQIVFLDAGKVTGMGKHDELMNTHRKYTDFVEGQNLIIAQ
ncbi:ATP-binding cassette, subfamily B, AbcA/BmrA [Thermoactinomyces sp. DSM 45891]|uniref:ABC transporter ATP-binding protein n=1 Tax=Thermoactinomyces sp. DSM 45891 TaxID=1761907 RepID=UPI0009141929|nr:ABC transporter ATP-binding protein [Thermoactinomyces sp. DSM 45891]SFX30554.1 ATP-binding cassette, subfamily B, AbcA/BmrA [Thermoactinomyces sp. DSM 45891]